MDSGSGVGDGREEIMTTPALSVIIPAYNEAECLERSLQRVRAVMPDSGQSFELIVVDDGSVDETWQALAACRATMPELKGFRLSRNFGKENALCAGLDAAAGRGVLLLDADMQHPPELIPQMIEAWKNGAEVVEAVKRARGRESFFSRLTAKLFCRLMGNMTDFDLYGASDFKLLDRKAVDAWKSMGERNVFFRGMSAWVGFARVQIPFDVSERAGGSSKWSKRQLFGLALKALTAFSMVPLRVVSMAGLLFLLFAVALGAQTLYQYFSGQAVTGFATVILLLLIVSSLVMLALGVIGEYIARIYEEVKQRPRYIVSERL